MPPRKKPLSASRQDQLKAEQEFSSFCIVDQKDFRKRFHSALQTFALSRGVDLEALDPYALEVMVLEVISECKCVGLKAKPNLDVDVVLGRNTEIVSSKGNQRAKAITGRYVAEYDSLHVDGARRVKGNMLSEIVAKIKRPEPTSTTKRAAASTAFHAQQQQHPNKHKGAARFIKQLWVPLTEDEERQKVGHWLRDHKSSSRTLRMDLGGWNDKQADDEELPYPDADVASMHSKDEEDLGDDDSFLMDAHDFDDENDEAGASGIVSL